MIGEPELSYQVLACQRQRRRAYCLFNYVYQDGLEMFHFPEQRNLMLLRKKEQKTANLIPNFTTYFIGQDQNKGNNNYLYIHDKKKRKVEKGKD